MSIFTVKRVRWFWLLLLIPALVLMGIGLGKCYRQLKYPVKYTALVEKYSARYTLDEALLYAVIDRESSFDPKAVSSIGALGLTQITPETFRWLQSKTGETLADDALFDPETSIRYGALLLSMHLKEFGGVREAIAAYHAGRGAVGGWLKKPELSPDGKTLKKIPYEDTDRHVTAVMNAYHIYQKYDHKGEKTT